MFKHAPVSCGLYRGYGINIKESAWGRKRQTCWIQKQMINSTIGGLFKLRTFVTILLTCHFLWSCELWLLSKKQSTSIVTLWNHCKTSDFGTGDWCSHSWPWPMIIWIVLEGTDMTLSYKTMWQQETTETSVFYTRQVKIANTYIQH